MFIAFEGIEGSGKSTLMDCVASCLHDRGFETLLAREPGGTGLGDAVRAVFLARDLTIGAVAETMLINASRAQLVGEVIRPAIDRGVLVLCDRYVYSTLAYQGYGRGLPISMVRSVCDAATGGLMPDLTLLVDVSFETSRARLASREGPLDRVEREDRKFHRRVRDGYLEISREDRSVVTIDGERSQQAVVDAAMAALDARL